MYSDGEGDIVRNFYTLMIFFLVPVDVCLKISSFIFIRSEVDSMVADSGLLIPISIVGRTIGIILGRLEWDLLLISHLSTDLIFELK